MNVLEQENLHIEGENGINIKDVISQIPNNTMKKFYIKKLNSAIKNVYIDSIDLKDLIEFSDSFSSEKTSIEFIIREIVEVEENHYEELSNTPILSILKMAISSIIQKAEHEEKYIKEYEISKRIMSVISEWGDIDDNIREVNLSSIYTLYEYIQDEDVKNKVLVELKEFYEEMF